LAWTWTIPTPHRRTDARQVATMADLLWQRTSTEPASRVTNDKVSSRQVSDSHLDRIGEVKG